MMSGEPQALVHGIWLDPEPDGQMLPGLCLAGPLGDGFRRMLNPGAVKGGTLEATSPFDAMTKYWALMGWGTYRTTSARDHEAYPLEWNVPQRS